MVLDVLNATNNEMELNYSLNKAILIEPKETCRIPVPVDRCPLRNENNSPKLSLRDRCKNHLVSQVNLEYTIMGAQEIKGQASIGTIEWNATMLNTILMAPLQWQVQFDGHKLSPEKPEFSCAVGQYVACAISISNCSEHPLKSLCLWLQVYQDNQNGSRNYRLDMKRALFGSDKVFIDEVTLPMV